MIVKMPTNDYEKEILEYCKNIPKLPEGEKSIIYDLATQAIPNQAYIDFRLINIKSYMEDIIIIYNKHKSSPIINLVNMFIKKNNLVSKTPDTSISNTNFGGNYNDTSKGITSK